MRSVCTLQINLPTPIIFSSFFVSLRQLLFLYYSDDNKKLSLE